MARIVGINGDDVTVPGDPPGTDDAPEVAESCASCFYGRQPQRIGNRDALRCFASPPVAMLVPQQGQLGTVSMAYEFVRAVVAPDDVCAQHRFTDEAVDTRRAALLAGESVADTLGEIARYLREGIGAKGGD